MKARLYRSDAMVAKDGVETETTVEAEWFQLTYELLRKAPDGDNVAFYDAELGGWLLAADKPSADQVVYSDIVIWDGTGE